MTAFQKKSEKQSSRFSRISKRVLNTMSRRQRKREAEAHPHVEVLPTDGEAAKEPKSDLAEPPKSQAAPHEVSRPRSMTHVLN